MSFDLKILNGDIQIASNGDLEPIFNEDKLIQDMLKSLFTPTGSHKLHPWYGSPLLDNSVGSVLDPDILKLIIDNGIKYSLSNIKTLQAAQETGGQYLTPREILKSIDNITAYQDEADLRKMVVIISVTTRTGATVEESFTINL